MTKLDVSDQILTPRASGSDLGCEHPQLQHFRRYAGAAHPLSQIHWVIVGS